MTPETVPGSTEQDRNTYCIGRGTAGGDHCCYVNGKTCRYLADNGPDAERRFECSLRRDLGSWDAVHADPGYQEHVQPAWEGTAAQIPTQGNGDTQFKVGDTALTRAESL